MCPVKKGATFLEQLILTSQAVTWTAFSAWSYEQRIFISYKVRNRNITCVAQRQIVNGSRVDKKALCFGPCWLYNPKHSRHHSEEQTSIWKCTPNLHKARNESQRTLKPREEFMVESWRLENERATRRGGNLQYLREFSRYIKTRSPWNPSPVTKSAIANFQQWHSRSD